MEKYIKENDLFKRILNVDFKHDYDGSIKFCQSIPAADVAEVRHGRWKPFDLTWGRSIYTCTACGDAFEVPTEYGSGKPMYEFCPYCGAKMDEEVNK